MKIKEALFAGSSTRVSERPKQRFPEFAFIGRSNVGKSSLINMLTANKKLAMTSSKPGKTRLVNHFLINRSWYLVDLPGYGYAKVTGCRGAAKRKLLAGALAVMMPTLYPEPFGYVAAEAMLSGTPVLATAWGAFPEIIRSGVSGWCCASPGEFVRAARKARSIRRQGVRDWALRHFTVDAVAASYRRYLRALSVPPDSAAGRMAWLRL